MPKALTTLKKHLLVSTTQFFIPYTFSRFKSIAPYYIDLLGSLLYFEVGVRFQLMNTDPFVAQLPGTTQDHLQIFNIELKAKMKSYQMPEQVPDYILTAFTGYIDDLLSFLL